MKKTIRFLVNHRWSKVYDFNKKPKIPDNIQAIEVNELMTIRQLRENPELWKKFNNL